VEYRPQLTELYNSAPGNPAQQALTGVRASRLSGPLGENMKTRNKNRIQERNFEQKIVYPNGEPDSEEDPVRLSLSTEAVHHIRNRYGGLRSYIIENKTLQTSTAVLFSGEKHKLSNTSFRKTTFESRGSIFRDFTSERTQRIRNCDFSRSSFIGAIVNVEFIDCNFQGAKFDKAKFKNVVFMNCNFTGTLFCKEVRDIGDDPNSSMFRHSYNWNKVDRSRIKYDKNAKGMNPDRAVRARLNNKKRKKSKKKKGIDLKKIRG